MIAGARASSSGNRRSEPSQKHGQAKEQSKRSNELHDSALFASDRFHSAVHRAFNRCL
jgi:hypothetical protein